MEPTSSTPSPQEILAKRQEQEDALHETVRLTVSGYLKNNLDKNNNPSSKHFAVGLKESIESGIKIKNPNSKDAKVNAFLEYIGREKKKDDTGQSLRNSHIPLHNLMHEIAEDYAIDISDGRKVEGLAELVFQSELDILIKRGQGGDVESSGGSSWNNLDEDQKEKYRDNVITKRVEQVNGIERWIKYVSSDEVIFPAWYKYFVVTSLRSMGVEQFELGTYTYGTRDQKTLFRFPTLNPAVLAKVYTRMLSAYTEENRNKKVPTKYDIQDAVLSNINEAEHLFLEKYAKEANFTQLYAYELSKYKEATLESRRSTEGLWVMYNQQEKGSEALKQEASRLSMSLEDKGTEWCTEQTNYSESQLASGDFYVYYTREDFDKDTYGISLLDMSEEEKRQICTMPRIAIKMANGKINELRGIVGGQDQDLEPEMLDIATAKCKGDTEKGEESLPGKEEYEKKAQDMKQLLLLIEKQEKEMTLTRDDLLFLYEVNSMIEGFGHDKDPRIEELKGKRNRQEDVQSLCNCTPEYIAYDFIDIIESTQVFCEDDGTKITFFDFREEKNKEKLPQLLDLAKSIKASGSPARPDMAFGGIVSCAITQEQSKSRTTLEKSFEDADGGTPPYIWPEWKNAPFTQPASLSFEAVVLSYNSDPTIRKSSDKILADMDKLGLRPLTLEEMTIAGISYPTFTKTDNRYFVGLTKYALGGDSYVPSLCLSGDERRLGWCRWDDEWDGEGRFLCVRK